MDKRDNLVIDEILQKRDVKLFRQWCLTLTPSEIAHQLSMLEDPMQQLLFFRMLRIDTAAEVFTYLATEEQSRLIAHFTSTELSNIINELYTDEVVDLIEEMPHNISRKIYRSVANPEERSMINKLLKYDDDQVGSVMSVDLVWLESHLTCEEALEQIKSMRFASEIVSHFFVVDKMRHVIGAIEFQELFFESNPKRCVAELAQPVETLRTQQAKEAAAHVFAQHDLPVLPVVNSVDILVGMLTADDVIDVLQEESTEDIYKSAGISTRQEYAMAPYASTTVWEIVKSRIFWLAILMIGATISQWIINSFQLYIIEYHEGPIPPYMLTAIDSIIPVIAGTAGNAGSQSATTITRALALGESHSGSMIRKEVKVGLTIGVILAVINIIRLMLYYLISGQLLGEYGHRFILLSITSSLTIFLVIFLSKLVGTTIPLIAIRLGRDPAVMSSPTLATITDALATTIFFSLAIFTLSYLFY